MLYFDFDYGVNIKIVSFIYYILMDLLSLYCGMRFMASVGQIRVYDWFWSNWGL